MKKGFFKITDVIYRNDWQIVSLIFKDFRPLHIEFRHWENNVWYLYGESEFFAPVEEGVIPPQYDITVTSNEDGTYTLKYTKVI